MKKNFGKKTYLYPMPVFIVATYDKENKANAMVAAWGGIYDTNKVFVCVDPSHQTAKNLVEKKAFTLSMADAAHVAECDYLGIESGKNEENKLEKCGFTVTKAEFVDAPVINELAMCIECSVLSYDITTGCMVAEIENVSADEEVLTDGKIDVTKLGVITYDSVNHNYIKLGEIVGKAFSDGNKIK